MHRVTLLIHHEVEVFFDVTESLLSRGQFAIGDAIQLHPLNELLAARIL
jgi:hypothetical protein